MDPVVGVHVHRPELEQHEGLHHLADPRLSEEDRARRLELHQGHDDQQHRRKSRQQREAPDDVESPLQRVAKCCGLLRRADLEEQGIDRSAIVLPVQTLRIGMHVQANRQVRQGGRAKLLRELAADPPLNRTGHHRVASRHIGEDDAHRDTFLEPAQNVRLPIRRGERVDRPIQDLGAAGGHVGLKADDHQHQRLIDTFGALPFPDQDRGEDPLADDVGRSVR